jgi:AraC-like DNA-binding protein
MDPLEPRGAVLHPRAAASAFRIRRHEPTAALAPFVRHYWFAEWDLGDGPPFVQRTLTHPAVNLVVEGERSTLAGVATRRFDRVLVGAGRVVGVLFRPAGFQPFYRRSMHELTDRVRPAEELLPGDAAALRASLAQAPDDSGRIAALEAFLIEGLPPVEPEAQRVDAIMERAERERTLRTAEELAGAVSVSLRKLQRQMRHYVGVGPKWVLRRFRLQEAADRLARGEPVDQTELAHALGYYDQAHFVRDFAEAVGSPPGKYAAEERRARPRCARPTSTR